MKRTAAAIFVASLIALPASSAFAQSGFFGHGTTSTSGHVEVEIEIEGSTTSGRHNRHDRHDRSRDDDDRRRDRDRHKKRRRGRNRDRDRHDDDHHRRDRYDDHHRHDDDHHHRRKRHTHRHHDHCEHHHETVSVMDSEDFGYFMAQLRDEPFSSERMALLRMVARDNYFTVSQVQELVWSMTFSSEKVDAAVLLYPRTVDQEDFYKVFSVFAFDSSKREVRERLGLI